MPSVLNLVRPEILKLRPYATENAVKNKILLNANENPFAQPFAKPSNRYPFIRPANLITFLSKYYKVKPDNIIASAGSDGAIDVIMRTFIRPGKDSILLFPPTFSMYSFYAQVQGANVLEAPLNKGKLDVKAAAKVIKAKKPKVIFIPNPSAPLGFMFGRNDILAIINAAKNTSIVVVDEAYIEFAGAASFTNLINKHSNLIVLRTLSKAFALAGARVGFAITNAEVTGVLQSVLPPYPLAVTSIKAAEKLFGTPSALKKSFERVNFLTAQRDTLYKEFKKLGFGVYPSRANFLFIKTEDDSLYNFLYARGIITRRFKNLGVRISVGTQKENKILVKALKKYLERNKK